jgi:cell pole-organizing protein PopZ
MASSSPQHEPTMEEILASIRKIISEDTAPETPPPPQDNDVLELTQEVAEEPTQPAVAAAPPQPAAQEEPTPQPVSAAQPDNDIVFVSHEETTVSHSAESPDHDGIFSDKARKAIDDAFAGLDGADEAPAAQAPKPTAVSGNGNSVEAVFERAVRSGVEPMLTHWMDGHRDELMSAVKPLLREWMDEHFPALLEGAVRDEVARVVKARGRR